MDILLAPAFIIPILIGRIVTKRLLHFEPEVVIGTMVYFVWLIIARSSKSTYRLCQRNYIRMRGMNVQLPQKIQEVHSVLDINSVYRLSGLEVVLGFDHSKRPIRIDLDKYHTILAGVSGAGKTIAINGLIAQLVTRPYFREEYEIYLLDLKSSKNDYLAMWKPVLTGYYGIDERGSSEQAIAALDTIAENMHRNDTGKRILLIVDELAMLTTQSTDNDLRKRGHAVMQRLSAQLRDRGAIFSATQRPHYEVVSRGVTSQMERKICLRVDDADTAKMILRFKPTTNCTVLKDGEFVLKEPGSRIREQVGRTMMMDLPGEIDVAVSRVIAINTENDDRLKLFQMAASTLNCGDTLPGVNSQMWKGHYKVVDLQTAYKNFAMAGATTPHIDKRNQPNGYVLNGDYKEMFGLVVKYIQDGQWKAAPETIRE